MKDYFNPELVTELKAKSVRRGIKLSIIPDEINVPL